MKAKDLRTGNYIYTHNRVSMVWDVINIVEKFSIGDKKRDEVVNEIKTSVCYLSPQPENKGIFTPIPITERWLKSFGFDDAGYKAGYIGKEFKGNMIMDFVLTKPKFMGEWQHEYCFELRSHRFVEIKYVHELQNLFFALTEIELELK